MADNWVSVIKIIQARRRLLLLALFMVFLVSASIAPVLAHCVIISASPSSASVNAGEAATFVITVDPEPPPYSTTSGTVQLSVLSGVPANATYSFSREILQTPLPKTANLTIQTTSDTPAGTYTVKVNVYNTEPFPYNHDTSVTLEVAETVAPPAHDVAVIDLTADTTVSKPGQDVAINVKVKNEGDFSETFNVTAYYDSSSIGTKNVANLASSTETTLSFTWNTTGLAEKAYTIRALASTVANETDVADNEKSDLVVTLKTPSIHDVAITSVIADVTAVKPGEVVAITVTTRNEGDFSETFTVTTYYDGTVIDTKTVTNLAPGIENTISFTWDTSDVAEQVYTIKAMASTGTNETDVTNNEKSGSEITVKTPSPDFTLPTYAPIAVVAIIIIACAVILYMKKK